MNRSLISVFLCMFATLGDSWTMTHAGSVTDEQSAMELGRKVLAVMEAIQYPEAPNAMQAVIDLGQDQRYYVMVRGWLQYKLDGDRSILRATAGQLQADVEKRVHFLEQAIRAIDLE